MCIVDVEKEVLVGGSSGQCDVHANEVASTAEIKVFKQHLKLKGLE